MKLNIIYINIVLRIIGTFFATGGLLGFLMYCDTNHPASAGVPLALLLLSLPSVQKIKTHPWLLIVVFILVTLSYTLVEIPFLNAQLDAVARILHLMNLLLICSLLLYIWGMWGKVTS